MSEDEDVKQLLGRAFTQEPPLSIDRDEVLHQGRKRLRRKRVIEAGSVVAAVVIAAVGAATLTNLADEPDRLPPAASTTASAPAGPSLPLTTSPPTAATTQLPRAMTGPDFPQQLAQRVYQAGVLAKDEVHPAPGEPAPPTFVRYGDEYVLIADVVRPKRGLSGSLKLTVDFAPGAEVTCKDAPRPYIDCTQRPTAGTPITVANINDEDGRRIFASTISRSGMRVTALVSNHSYQDTEKHVGPSGPPAMSQDELCVLVSKAGLGAL
jgi:hypothetical protein